MKWLSSKTLRSFSDINCFITFPNMYKRASKIDILFFDMTNSYNNFAMDAVFIRALGNVPLHSN